MKSYARERERIGPLPYLVQAAPRRQPDDLDWWPILKMAAQFAAVAGCGWVFIKIIWSVFG